MILRIAGSNKYNNFIHNRQVGGNGRWRTRLVLEVAGQGCRRRPEHGCLAASAGDENVGTLVEWAAGAPAAARDVHGSGALEVLRGSNTAMDQMRPLAAWSGRAMLVDTNKITGPGRPLQY